MAVLEHVYIVAVRGHRHIVVCLSRVVPTWLAVMSVAGREAVRPTLPVYVGAYSSHVSVTVRW